MQYKISKEAKHDLEKIWLYTFENWSIEQADYYFSLLINEIEVLSENPKFGQDISLIRKGYFRSKVKSHFIYYRINSQKDEIEIIRILHQQMNTDAQLGL